MMPALFGLDMLTLFGMAIVGCGALGWLLGPVLGGALFRAMNRTSMPGMVQVRFFQLLFLFPFFLLARPQPPPLTRTFPLVWQLCSDSISWV